MTSPELLESHDRCQRAPFLARAWEKRNLHPTAALHRAVEAGLESAENDPGQCAGDSLMTLATERGLESPQNDLYGLAMHLAALADFATWMLRPDGKPWARPADTTIGKEPWVSSAFLSESGTRLKRFLLVERWDEQREIAESHSWRTAGECAAYRMPMDMTVLVIGSNRAGRRHGPFTKGWLHPVAKNLRMRKRDGKGFTGEWVPVFREDWEGSRDGWLDAMTNDGVLADAVFHVEQLPHPESAKIRKLAEKKLAAIRTCDSLPDPQPSQCSGISPCQFIGACWSFQPPSTQLGFIRAAT